MLNRLTSTSSRIAVLTAVFLATLTTTAHAQQAPAPATEPVTAPFKYAPSKAYHVLKETTTDESGYFSLVQGHNGRIYVGTAAYGRNAYLVEFNPETETQRIVIDIQKLIGASPKGMKAQSKLHTRNFVGKSGKIYVGSKQGYALKGENPLDYPGGYIASYDPKAAKAELIAAVPYRAHGVGDVAVDEARHIIYVCTQDDVNFQALWLRYDTKTKQFRGLFSNVTFFGMTLLTRDGGAHVITDRNQIVSYHPDTEDLRVRPMLLDDKPFRSEGKRLDGAGGVPMWFLMPDGRTAYVIYLSEPTLYRMDLLEEGDAIHVEALGDMIQTDDPTDTRGSLAAGPDGKVYNVIREKNTTGFGGNYLHHLASYDPATNAIEDLGVLTVSNPDFYGRPLGANGAVDEEGKRIPWTHGFHTLPDGALTPLHAHLAMTVADNGDVYTTILYPFTLLRTMGVAK